MNKEEIFKSSYESMMKEYNRRRRESVRISYNTKIHGMKADWIITDDSLIDTRKVYVIGNKKLNVYITIDDGFPNLTDNMEYVTKFKFKDTAIEKLAEFENLGYHIDYLSVFEL